MSVEIRQHVPGEDTRDFVEAAYAVFEGPSPQQDGPVRVMPIREFCTKLDEVLG